MLARVLVLAVAFLALPALAADPGSARKDKADVEPPKETTSVTRRTVTIGGRQVAYTATAGTLHLKNDKGEPRASLFYIAYTRDGVADRSRRPVTFTFNGGPGSSSVWLHLGTFGPRRVQFADAEAPAPAPYGFVDNAESVLDVTDLVFIDPVGTGYSRPLGDAKLEEFTGVEEDVRAVGEFIRRWTTRHQRWQSPKFLAGESYGTTRAAALVNHLQQCEGMFFNGAILVSSILNFQTARFDTGNDLPYITFLPTYAATAWYHQALAARPAELEPLLDEVRRFAAGEYAQALMKGRNLGEAEAAAVADKVARYTGLSAEFVRRANLRVDIGRFTKELLRAKRRSVGRLDSRYLGIDQDAAGERVEHDPSLTAIMGPYTAALYDYVRGELKFEDDRKYEILSGSVNRSWKWGDAGSGGRLRQRRGGPARRDVAESASQGAGRERLLRPRHAVLRHRVHLRPPGARAAPPGQRLDDLLSGRPHDVRARALARQAETGHRRLHRRRHALRRGGPARSARRRRGRAGGGL
jgi:carboxypeptidase C (cathepsin A)